MRIVEQREAESFVFVLGVRSGALVCSTLAQLAAIPSRSPDADGLRRIVYRAKSLQGVGPATAAPSCDLPQNTHTRFGR